MLKRLKTLPSPALVIAFIALVAALGTGSAVALVGKNTVAADDIKKNAVRASEIKKNAVGASEIKSGAVRSSEVQNDSLTGADIDEGSLNVGGGGGGGANLVPFNARLTANGTLSREIGNFTVRGSANGAGTCGAIQLLSGDLDSQRSIGLNAAFANLAANATVNITNLNVSQAFTAVSDNGASSVSGVVGRAQQGGGICLLSGYLTGN